MLRMKLHFEFSFNRVLNSLTLSFVRKGSIMNEKKIYSIIALAINSLALIFLFVIALPYLSHDTTITNPDAMLPMESWDRAGMLMTFSFFPILFADTLGFMLSSEMTEKIYLRLLHFIPAISCLVMVLTYWI